MYKSKCCKETLNPRWDEEFEVPINMNCEVLFRVYDKDFGPRDDFMGDGVLSLTRLKNTYEDITIDLSGSSNPNEDLGCIHFEAKLTSINHEVSGVRFCFFSIIFFAEMSCSCVA